MYVVNVVVVVVVRSCDGDGDGEEARRCLLLRSSGDGELRVAFAPLPVRL